MYLPEKISLEESYNMMLRHWEGEEYPKLVYVETTNVCNARCRFCLYERMERSVQTMEYKDFCFIADKVKSHGLMIGAMFCFGEPLADPGLFSKIRYGRQIGVLKSYLGLNTNCSLLIRKVYDDILATTNNITLSFTNVGKDFEILTGLNWESCYRNAIEFIKYRDQHKPKFKIHIGCNDVTGHNRKAVKQVFKDYDVEWARDAQICWGDKVITGVIDRSIMYNKWTCDGFKGAIQIKPNGDCCFCAYDVIRNETRFANIFDNSWEEIEEEFKRLWKRPSSLCLRCDFWWNYYQMISGGWKRGSNITDSWQDAYILNRRDYWDENHEIKSKRFLTGSKFIRVRNFLCLDGPLAKCEKVLNIGLGLGSDTREMVEAGLIVDGFDISPLAIKNLEGVISNGFTSAKSLPSDTYDLVISHLVAQHMTDIDLFDMMIEILRSLKVNGIFALQYASPIKEEQHIESVYAQQMGLVRRTREDMFRIVDMAGGEIVKDVPTKYFDPVKATDDNCWNGVHIKRKYFVKPIGGLNVAF